MTGATLVLAATRWWLLLRVQDIRLPLRRLCGLNFIGQFFNAFLPGSTGGDVIRIYYILREVPDRKALATLSIVVDRAFGLLALLLVAAVALPSQLAILEKDPNTRQIAFLLYLLLGVGLVSGVIALYAPIHRLPGLFHRLWLRVPGRGLVAELFQGARAYGRSIPLSLSALALGCVVHLSNFVASWIIMRALGLEVGFLSAVVMMALIVTAMSLPISVSGHGVREFMFILMFTLYGIIGTDAGQRDSEYAVATAFLYFARDLVWSLVGGIVYLLWSHARKADPALK